MAVKMDSLPTLVRQTRKQAGLSQAELADLAGVGKTLIFDLEKGHRKLSFENLQKICRVLNIRIEFHPPKIP